jgi:formamidopyrimidine-DNA glycosylase
MPELPDIEAYLTALRPRVVGRQIHRLRILSPFVLRTFEPPVESVHARTIRAVSRLGKRFIFELDADALFIMVHLMIAGRWRWSDAPATKRPGKGALFSIELDRGTLTLIESSTQKRASLHLLQGADALRAHDPGGLDVLTCSADAFRHRLQSENHTLKRSLTDPRLFDGIGNAYSDEILHAAGLSPVTLSTRLTSPQVDTLHRACRDVLTHWTVKLQHDFANKFPAPQQITAFRPDFAVHGRFGLPCPTCGTKVQRIRYAENETNYCPRCQTAGRILADRSLSRLLKKDWPATIDELESDH